LVAVEKGRDVKKFQSSRPVKREAEKFASPSAENLCVGCVLFGLPFCFPGPLFWLFEETPNAESSKGAASFARDAKLPVALSPLIEERGARRSPIPQEIPHHVRFDSCSAGRCVFRHRRTLRSLLRTRLKPMFDILLSAVLSLGLLGYLLFALLKPERF